jgi:hypothetical protein
LSTQTDTIAGRRSEASKTTIDPCAREYWTQERLEWLEEIVSVNRYLYEGHLESARQTGRYQPSTGELIRRMKKFPEWAGLSTREAHDALAIGLAKLADAGVDPWSLLPENDIKYISAEEDFIDAWPKVRANDIDLAAVVQQAKASPVKWSPALEDNLSPVSPQFRLFCDVCMYLQSMVGPNSYILLPQYKLAPLLGTRQGGISSYCNRAIKAGFLEELNGGRWSHAQHQAKQYRCLSSLGTNQRSFSESEDYCD